MNARTAPNRLSKFIATFLVLVMFSGSAMAAPEAGSEVVSALNAFGAEMRSRASRTDAAQYLSLPKSILTAIGTKSKAKARETIDRVEIQQRNLSVLQGERIEYVATGYRNGQPVGGVPFRWTIQREGTDQMRTIPNGRHEASLPGRYTVRVTAEGLHAETTLNVALNPGYNVLRILRKPESERTEAEQLLVQTWIKTGLMTVRNISSRDRVDVALETGLTRIDQKRRALAKQIAAKEQPQPTDSTEASELEESTAGRPDLVDPIGWDGTNWATADDPVNWVGRPILAGSHKGAANGNYNLTIPAVNLNGRGDLDINLNLEYNSRLWSKAGSEMTYNADSGYPAPGWNLGFGKMLYMGSTGGCMPVAADGTRRSYTGGNSVYNSGGVYSHTFTGSTTDGSMMDFSCNYYNYGSYTTLTGWAKLPNGTTMTFASPSPGYDQTFPTRIQDRHGNYINVTYVSGQGPNISTITDTLGRTITFNYNGAALRSISGPGYNGTTRYFIRIQYDHQTLPNTNATGWFNGLTPVVANTTPYQIKAIYYPTTNNGYWFGDTNQYSPYGIIRQIKSQRGMNWNSGPDTIDAGTTNRDETYNFPTAATSSLTDSPGYSSHTETFDGIDTSSLVTNYSFTTSGSEETVTVERPDLSLLVQKSHITGTVTNGLQFENRIEKPNGDDLEKTVTTIGSGAYSSPRPTEVTRTDDQKPTPQTTRTEFTYGSVYNQVAAQKEYDYNNSLYREKRFTYENSANYTGRHIFSLVTSVEDYGSSNDRLTRTVFTYDGVGLTAASGIVQHDYTHDPHTSETVQGSCLMWNPDGYGCTYEGEQVFVNGLFELCNCTSWDTVSAYQWTTGYRGNLTNMTTYTDGAAATGAISYDYTYDIAGNERTSTTNCCQQIGSSYSTNTQYLYPDSVTKGSSNTSSPDRITQSFSYDSNTKLPTSMTDFNGLTTTVAYDAAYRPTVVTMNSGGKMTTTHNDSSLNRNEHVQLANNATVSNSTVYLNGRGQVKTSTHQAGSSSYNGVQVKYDPMGRQWKVSRPYDTSSSPSYWTETLYDYLGRPTTQTAADASSVTSFTYNQSTKPSSAASNQGQTVTTTDAWGRERWARYDAFSRLVEAVEPNPTGTDGDVDASGNMGTTYLYDRLDRLITIVQGDQTRSFAYDSLGRLTRQKLAEHTATINDSGSYVGGGGSWSHAFTYDARSNLIQRMDARGAITSYDYTVSSTPDPLNRVQSISGSLASGVTGIDLAPTATFEYMTTGNKTRVKKITTSGVAVEENAFDSEGRVSEYKITFDGRSSYPMETDYSYDTGHRLTQIDYPVLYGVSGAPRRVVVPSYDVASRLTQLNVDGTTRMGDVTYNTSSQVTQLKTAPSMTNGKTETYTYDAATGLLTGQTLKKVNTSTTYMNMSYSYDRGGSAGSTSAGKTGQLTEIVDNYSPDATKKYEFDALGRLKVAKGGLAAGASGITADWSQTYTYDRYGNRTSTTSAGVDWDNVSVPTDGIASLSYGSPNTNNRISGWNYDEAGNLTRGQNVSGTWQRYEYDSAGRLKKVKTDAGADLETYSYGADRLKLKTETAGSHRTYYVWGGSKVIAEYTEAIASSAPAYSKVYYYAGERLVSSNANGSSVDLYHHPDRLSTKIVSNSFSTSLTRQATLPFGTEFPAEGSGALLNNGQLFTSYDRSGSTGLDYANNRTYSSGQGRFTQVDPIGMAATDIGRPQSNNLYSYVQNMPTDFVDPDGLQMRPVQVCIPESWDPQTGTLRLERCYTSWEDDGTGYGGVSGGNGPGTSDTDSPLTPPQDDDCLRFANGVANFAQGASSTRTAMSRMYSQFGGEDANRRSSGFRSDYTDDVLPGNSPNQVRHAAFALYYGYVGGAAYWLSRNATLGANIPGSASVALALTMDTINHGPGRERTLDRNGVPKPPTPSQQADKRLNGVAGPAGFNIGNGAMRVGDLAAWIRNTLCG